MKFLEHVEQMPSRKQMAALFLVGFTLLFLTTPLNLVRGYLLAEEGSTYLRYARAVSPLHGLIAIHQGYYSLIPNVAMLLPARWLPLVTAAWIGEWTGLFFRLWTVYFLATCDAIKSFRARLIAVILVMLLPGAANVAASISVGFYLGAIAAILLLSDPSKRMVSSTIALVLGGLTTPASSMLLPFFLLRAWKLRSRAAFLQATVVALGTAFQYATVRATVPYERGTPELGPVHIYFDILANHFLVLPFFTRVSYHYLAHYLQYHVGLPWICFFFVGAALAALLLTVLWKAGPFARKAFGIAFYSACVFVLIGGAYTNRIGGDERYYITSATLTAVALVVALDAYQRAGRRRLYQVTSVLVLLFGVSGVLDVARFFKMQQEPLHWQQQIAAWKQDPTYRFHNGPWFWGAAYPLSAKPVSLDLPFYTFDSLLRPKVAAQLPSAWFGPLDEATQPKSLPGPLDTSQ